MKRLLVLLVVLAVALIAAVPCYASGFTPSVTKGKTAPDIVPLSQETDPETGETVTYVAEIVRLNEDGSETVTDKVREIYLFVTSYSDYKSDNFDPKMNASTKLVVKRNLDKAFDEVLAADTMSELNSVLDGKSKLIKPNYDATIYRASDLFEVSLISEDEAGNDLGFMGLLLDPNVVIRATFDLRMPNSEPTPVVLHQLERDSELGKSGEWVIVDDEDITRNENEETGYCSLTITFRDLCAVAFLRAMPDEEALALRDVFGGEGKAIVTRENEDSPFKVKLIGDLDQTVSIPASFDNIELNLNGHTIKGQDGTEEHPDGAPAILFEEKKNEDDPGTSLAVSDQSEGGGGQLLGGDAAVGGKGGASVTAEKDAPRAELTIGAGTKAAGGNGTTGGDGVSGNISAKVEGNAYVKGGDGYDGDADHPDGGNGGAGLNCADSQVAGGIVYGGDGGDGFGENSNGGSGGTAAINISYATSGELYGGNGGNGGPSGKGGTGGHGILVDKNRTEESIPVIKPGKTEEIKITGGTGGNGGTGGVGGNGVRQENAAVVIDTESQNLDVNAGKSGTGEDGEAAPEAENIVVIEDEKPADTDKAVVNNYYTNGKGCDCWFCAHWWILLIPMIIIILLLILVIILLLRRKNEDDEEPKTPAPAPVVIAAAAPTAPAPTPAPAPVPAPKAAVPAKKKSNKKGLGLALLAGAAITAWNIYVYQKFKKD